MSSLIEFEHIKNFSIYPIKLLIIRSPVKKISALQTYP